MITYMISSGIINLNQVFTLIFTIASDGSNMPVGASKDIRHMPYMYEFTISLPGTFTMMANAPMMGMVNTAIPDEDCMKIENTI